MRLIPFLIASFLLVNLLLDWVFRRLDLQTEKLQFWVMATTGTSWVISLVYFILDPQAQFNPVWDAGAELLPSLAFSLDHLAAGMTLSVVGMIFVGVLSEQDEPQTNARLAAMGGVSVIGLGADSAYTLGLVWTILEGFYFYSSYRNKGISASPRKYLPLTLIRLSAPAALILVSLTLGPAGSQAYLTELDAQYGPVLIIAGLVGFLGWFLVFPDRDVASPSIQAGLPMSWIPAALGMIVIIRGGQIAGSGTSQIALPLVLSLLLLITALAGILLDRTPRLWFLSCGLMAATAAIIAGPESALIWAVVLLLPGLQAWRLRGQPGLSLVPLILALIGLLPVPFAPSWAGVSAFGKGLPGYMLGISYGILLGSVVVTILKNWGSAEDGSDPPLVLGIFGAAVLLISQLLISLKFGLFTASRELLFQPIAIWISILGLVPVLVLGNRLPLKSGQSWTAAGAGLIERVGKALAGLVHFLDRLVGLISRVFEEQGGLIWALLLGLLIISLINVTGG